MKTYIINLKNSIDRRNHIEKQLRQNNIPYEIVEAVDGRLIPEKELNRIREENPEQLPTEVGCMLSHLKVYRRIVDSGEPYALILEDDTEIEEPGLYHLADEIGKTVIQKNPESVALLTYYWCREGMLELRKMQQIGSYFVCQPQEIWGVARAGAYLISAEMAASLLAFHGDKVRANADSWVVYNNHQLLQNVYCIYPKPVEETYQFGSTIGYVHGPVKTLLKKIVAGIVALNIPFISKMIISRRKAFSQRFKNITLSS